MTGTGSLAVLVPAALAGAVAIGVTMAIERWGGRAGGLIGTVPTTIVPAAAGILVGSAGAADFRAAMAVAPAGMLLNAGFLYLWRVLPPHLPGRSVGARLALMTELSLAAWSLAAVATMHATAALRETAVPLLLVGVALTLVLAGVGAAACRNAPPAPRGTRHVGVLTLLARGLLAAAAVGTAVWLADKGGAVAAGIVAVFPAIFLTTMVSLWLSQGEAVPVGAVGPMMLGSTSVATYALLAAVLMPALGLGPGSALSWLIAATCVTVPAWLWLERHA
jgi:hypothetical protein